MKKTATNLRLLFLFAFILYSISSSFAQGYLGFSQGNFSGLNGVLYQPAEVVDNRMQVEINLFSGDNLFSNNYIKANRKYVFGPKNLPTFDSTYSFQDFRLSELIQKTNSTTKNATFRSDIMGPSFMFSINRKNGIAVTSRVRAIVNMDNFLKDFVDIGLAEFKDSLLYNQEFNMNQSRLSAMAWGEIGLTYGRVLLNKDVHFLKAGITGKYLMGIASGYFYNEDVSVKFFADDSLSLYQPTVTANNATIRAGVSDNIPLTGGGFDKYISGSGVGFDIGVVYEYRPDFADYNSGSSDMKNEPRNKNKYKLKVGFSALDLGSIKFTKHPEIYDFAINWQNYNINSPELSNDGGWLDSLGATKLADNKETYKMRLPTSYMLTLDYRPFKKAGFYANFTAFMATSNFGHEAKVREISRYTITPRFEISWFSVGIPISYYGMQYLNAGAFIHIGPLYIGSADILNLAFSKNIRGINVYGGLKVPIAFGGDSKKKTSDIDNDGVLDNMDKCIDVAGPLENGGCPYGDRDMDGVLDNADQCIDVPGPVENNGCPYGDKDSDGVLDNADKCIDVAGPIENNGCPFGDKDADGVLDNVDACIDVAGPSENKGCPYGDKDADGVLDKDDSCIDSPGPLENKGCPYLDTDGDSVLDKDDDCPKTPGVAENRGCPVLKKEEEAIIKRAFDNLEFDSGKDIIRAGSLASLNELADLMVKNPKWGLKLAGHTDNSGDDAKNMILSNQRATALKKYLTDRGASGDKIVVEYFGETRPIADNATPEGRQKNRRVEMTITFE
jgi:outer membrane protein OmpA-like peptidoglycan-associated protein